MHSLSQFFHWLLAAPITLCCRLYLTSTNMVLLQLIVTVHTTFINLLQHNTVHLIIQWI